MDVRCEFWTYGANFGKNRRGTEKTVGGGLFLIAWCVYYRIERGRMRKKCIKIHKIHKKYGNMRKNSKMHQKCAKIHKNSKMYKKYAKIRKNSKMHQKYTKNMQK